MISRQKRINFLLQHLTNKNIFCHYLTIEVAMVDLAQYSNEDKEKWRLLGQIHDSD